jgi:hypothetical protein
MKTRAILSSAATLLVIVLFGGMLQTANAQKVFATKSGQIYFNATGALMKIIWNLRSSQRRILKAISRT